MPTYKNEKSGNWYCSFYYTDWTGSRKRKKKEGFRTQREARDFEREFINRSKTDCTMLFSTLVNIYYEDCQSRLKPTTLYNKQFLINNKILPYFKDMSLNSINATTVRVWQNKLLTCKNEDGSIYSQTYVKTINNQLSAIFNYAKRYYRLPENPVAVCGSIGKSRAESMQFWTIAEFQAFLEAISGKTQSKAMFSLLFWTGIRIGELLALTEKDFDFMHKTLTINKNYFRLQGVDLTLTPKTPKSNRKIAIPDFLCNIMQDYILTQNITDSEARIFPVSRNILTAEMKRGCQLSEVKRIRIHDIRHSHASLLIELGFSPLLISERLGHEKIETTLQTYSHLYPNKHQLVAQRLEELNQPVR